MVCSYVGGVLVEIVSGIVGLVYLYFIGKCCGYGIDCVFFKFLNVG